MKKIISILITAAVLSLLPFQALQAWSSFRNEQGQGQANTIAAKTPLSPETTGAKWQIRFAKEGGTAYNSDPVITDAHIYIACKSTLYQLDKNGTILSSIPLEAPMNSVCRMCLNENRLFIPLSGGRMQCIDISTMKSLWASEAFGLQSLTTVYCANGFVYAGTTNATGTDGLFYCLSAEDGRTRWTYKAPTPCGYYWSGAVTDSGDNFVLFGGDDGILISHSAGNDTVLDTYDLSGSIPQTDGQSAAPGKIRAGITYDADTDAYYTTSTNGYLYQIKMTSQGTFASVTARSLMASRTPDCNCTSTPTICSGRIYVCSYNGLQGQIHVIDAASMSLVYTATSPDCRDIKSSPLVSTGMAGEENGKNETGSVCVYFTQNALPGGIYYIRDDKTARSVEIETLFTPKEGKQFCLSSIAADTDGTLYYSNDSGTFFAVQEGYAPGPDESAIPDHPVPPNEPSVPSQPSLPPQASSIPAVVPSATPPSSPVLPDTGERTPRGKKEKNSKKPGKPRKIRWKLKKTKRSSYRVTFTWKKGTPTAYTRIKISKRNKKISKKQWSRVYQTSAAKKTITLKSGTYRISFYGCQPDGKKSGAVNSTLHLPS